MYEQVTRIAEMFAALTEPIKEIEETLAQHEQQIQQLLDPTPPPPPPPPPRQGIIFDACFNQHGDDGNLYGFYWHQNSPVVVPSGAVATREGQHMAYCYLHRENSPHAYRTMGLFSRLDDMEPDTRDGFTFAFDQSYWLAISMFLPVNWVSDPLASILFQCQASPDHGEAYRQPCLSVYVKGNQWGIKTRWDTQKYRPAAEGTHWPHSQALYGADIAPDLGTWTDWVFHIIWTWQGHGLIEIWKNGNRVANRAGPNCSNDDAGPYPSFGVYEWSWRKGYWGKYSYNAIERQVWFDSIRIGDHTASYTAVAPGP